MIENEIEKERERRIRELESEGLISVSAMADELGMSYVRILKRLQKRGLTCEYKEVLPGRYRPTFFYSTTAKELIAYRTNKEEEEMYDEAMRRVMHDVRLSDEQLGISKELREKIEKVKAARVETLEKEE